MNTCPNKQKLAVIGNGMAGARTIEEIMKRGGSDQFDITVWSEENYGNYNRILLSNVLNGSQNAREIFLNPIDWYRYNNITLHHGAAATHIDREAKRVLDANGKSETYDKLIIATGSRPFVPPMEGLTLEDGTPKPGVFVFRTIDDCQKIAGYANKSRRAVVIGGGLLGLEAARGLINYGCEVHVIHLSPRLMDAQLDELAGAMLLESVQKMGLQVHLEKSTAAILGDDMVTGLQFKDGSSLECDMVVLSCGIKPNVELARDCGLSVGRAIEVNDQMQSVDDEDVYVVGECAQHNGTVYGLVAPLWEQGRVLADHITGANPNATYRGSKISTKLKVMGLELASMGVAARPEPTDEVVQWVEPSRGRYKKLVIRDGKLVGAILLGETGNAGRLMQLFEHGGPLPEAREQLLFEMAPPVVNSTSLEIMPDAATVCNCNAVNKGTIRKCVLGGTREVEGVMRATRAGTGCGSCKTLVREIVEWTVDSASA